MFYFFDFDSLRYIPSGQKNPKNYTDQMIYPKVNSVMSSMPHSNIIIGLCNHDQCSFGKKEFTAWEYETEFIRMAGCKIYDIKMNLYNSEGAYSNKYTDNRWWANPDILRKYIIESKMQSSDFCMVSGKTRDRNIASLLSINFQWTWTFFNWELQRLERSGEELHWRPDSIRSHIKNTVELEYTNNNIMGRRIFPLGATVFLDHGLNYKLKENAKNKKNDNDN